MRRTGLVYSKEYLLHDAGKHHIECGMRLSRTMEYLKETDLLSKLHMIQPKMCSEKDILRVHTKELLEEVKHLSRSGGGHIDNDTVCCPATYDVARLAAGGCIRAGDAVMDGTIDNAYALVRPPGHHASRNKAAGFCFFNNAAILARHLQEAHSLDRIFIFDWDVHAGNGTMDIFYEDPSVMNISIHQDPKGFYPGTGFLDQVGRLTGDGYTVNIPVPPGTGDVDYVHLLKEFALPLMDSFKPDFVLVCCGQDAHRDDNISGVELTENGFGEMTRLLVESAEKVCKGRVVCILEGGYELESFARSNHAILSALLGVSKPFRIEGEVKEGTDHILAALRDQFLHGLGAP